MRIDGVAPKQDDEKVTVTLAFSSPIFREETHLK